MPRSPRRLEIDVLDTAGRALKDIELIPTLLRSSSTDDIELIAGIRDFVLQGPTPILAMTDAALFLKMSRIRAELMIRGWHCYFSPKQTNERTGIEQS